MCGCGRGSYDCGRGSCVVVVVVVLDVQFVVVTSVTICIVFTFAATTVSAAPAFLPFLDHTPIVEDLEQAEPRGSTRTVAAAEKGDIVEVEGATSSNEGYFLV